MDRRFKIIKVVFNILAVLILFLYLATIFASNTSAQSSVNKNENPNNMIKLSPFVLINSDVIYITKASMSKSNLIKENSLEKSILNRAKAMTEVKWTPKYNLIEKKCSFTFIKGKTYQGIPYSEDLYQVTSVNGFLLKIVKVVFCMATTVLSLLV